MKRVLFLFVGFAVVLAPDSVQATSKEAQMHYRGLPPEKRSRPIRDFAIWLLADINERFVWPWKQLP